MDTPAVVRVPSGRSPLLVRAFRTLISLESILLVTIASALLLFVVSCNTQRPRPPRILVTDFRSFIGLEESVLFRSQLEESLTRECGSSCVVVESGEYDKILTGDWDLSIRNVDGRGTMVRYVTGTIVLIGRNGEGVPLLVGGEGAALKIISRDLLLSHRFFSS